MSDTLTERAGADQTSAQRESLAVRVIRFAGWTSVWLGLFLLGFVAHQLFVTTFFAQQNNSVLEAEAEDYFSSADIEEVPYVPSDVSGGPAARETPPAGGGTEGGALPDATLLVEAAPPEHEAFAIIRVPSIDRLKDGWAIVEGVSRTDLKNGIGHMPNTPLPGQPGNSVMSGHRTTYGAPFHEFDELSIGDVIEVETGLGVHTYEVRETIIVEPTAIWVTGEREGAWLTLTTCHPKFSSRKRLVVFAELVAGANADVIYP
jgi:sortase A